MRFLYISGIFYHPVWLFITFAFYVVADGDYIAAFGFYCAPFEELLLSEVDWTLDSMVSGSLG